MPARVRDVRHGGAQGAAAPGVRGGAAGRADAGLDGFETAGLIRGATSRARCRSSSSHAISKEREHVFRGYEAGAVDYVFKPYDPRFLRSKVAVFLELDAKSRAAARSQAILRAAFDDAPIGMARLDLEGRIDAANRALAALLGHRPADLRDRLFDDFVHRDDVDALPTRAQAFEHEMRLVSRHAARPSRACLSVSRARPGAAVPDVVVLQVQDLRERLRVEAERAQRVREQAARVEAERTSARLIAVQRISDAALGIAWLRRARARVAEPDRRGALGRHRGCGAPRARRHGDDLSGGVGRSAPVGRRSTDDARRPTASG